MSGTAYGERIRRADGKAVGSADSKRVKPADGRIVRPTDGGTELHATGGRCHFKCRNFHGAIAVQVIVRLSNGTISIPHLRKTQLPYFSIDNAQLMYNTHSKLFRHSF
jgi:hypothetical protein